MSRVLRSEGGGWPRAWAERAPPHSAHSLLLDQEEQHGMQHGAGATAPACILHGAHPNPNNIKKTSRDPSPSQRATAMLRSLRICFLAGRPEAGGTREKVSIWAYARSSVHVTMGRLPTFPKDAIAFLPKP